MAIINLTIRTIVDGEAASLWYHPHTKIVHHKLHRYVHGSEFRDVLSRGLEVFIAEGACKWLSDDRSNGPLKPADAKWAETVWGTRAIAAGWKYWSVVLPAKILGEMNMRLWIDLYAKQGVIVQAFSDPAIALQWLEQQK